MTFSAEVVIVFLSVCVLVCVGIEHLSSHNM